MAFQGFSCLASKSTDVLKPSSFLSVNPLSMCFLFPVCAHLCCPVAPQAQSVIRKGIMADVKRNNVRGNHGVESLDRCVFVCVHLKVFS